MHSSNNLPVPWNKRRSVKHFLSVFEISYPRYAINDTISIRVSATLNKDASFARCGFKSTVFWYFFNDMVRRWRIPSSFLQSVEDLLNKEVSEVSSAYKILSITCLSLMEQLGREYCFRLLHWWVLCTRCQILSPPPCLHPAWVWKVDLRTLFDMSSCGSIHHCGGFGFGFC